MKQILFVAADYANITNDGKLNIMGTFTEIYGSSFPARQASMHLVAQLGAELGEYGQIRDFSVKLLDEDATQIIEIKGQFQVPIGQRGRKPAVNIVLELKDVIFPKPGPYQFALFVEKDHKCDLTIYLNELEASKPAGG